MMLNNFLDKLARAKVPAFRACWPAFKVCGYTGLALAIVLSLTLVKRLDLSLLVIAGILMVAVLTFLAVAMATKIIVGEERLIFYHDFIAVVAVTSVLLWLLGQPILPYLDVTVLGVGTFLACGRVGCLMVGCCHGRPCHFGVCYREEHAAAGFTPHLAGVRLFPIQAVESLWVSGIVIAGCVLIWLDYTPGEAAAWFVVTYCPARFCFEFARWRPVRSYARGLTQPQWTSPILMAFIVGTELLGVLPFHQWHVVLTVCLIVATVVIAIRGRSPQADKYQLLDHDHVSELTEVIDLASNLAIEGRVGLTAQGADIHPGCTSLGIQISASRIKSAAGDVHHYALSSRNQSLNEETARVLAQLILQLKRKTGSNELIGGNHGVFHLLIHPLNS